MLFAYASDVTAQQALWYSTIAENTTNDALANSNIPVRIDILPTLVATGEARAGSLWQQQRWFREAGDNHLDDLASLRVSMEADLVLFWAGTSWPSNDPGRPTICGYGIMPSTVSGDAQFNFTPGIWEPFPKGFVMSSPECSGMSTAHEIGHALGAGHNPEETVSTSIRPFSWSYGHQVSGLASDIMSYGCSVACEAQVQFSSPRVGFLNAPGTPSGTSTRDNASSIADTSWAISQYGSVSSNDFLWYFGSNGAATDLKVNASTGQDMEAPYTPFAGDFNGDGIADQFWYYPDDPKEQVWQFGTAQGSFTKVESAVNIGSSVQPVVGDFDGDGRDDVFLYGPGSTTDAIWWGTANLATFGATANQSPVTVSGTDFRPFAGDFNGDGEDDLFWYTPGSGADYIWWGKENDKAGFVAHAGQGTPVVNGTYEPFSGDFNGDTFDDAFWYAPGSAADVLWVGTGAGISGTAAVWPSQANDRVPVVGDFNADQKEDVLWYGAGSATEALWWGQSSASSFGSVQASPPPAVGGTYLPTAGDFNGDGIDDIYWFAFG